VFEDEAQALEHRSVAQPVGIRNEQLVITMLAREVLVDNVCHTAHPAAEHRGVQHIHDGAGRIGDLDANLTAPHQGRAEQLVHGPDGDAVRGALDHLLTAAHPLPGDDEHCPEDLVGHAPVLACAPAADVAGAEHPVRDDPGILDPLAGPSRVERDSDVQATADSRQPSTTSEIRKKPSGAVDVEAERRRGVVGIKRTWQVAVQPLKQGAILSIDPLDEVGCRRRSINQLNLHAIRLYRYTRSAEELLKPILPRVRCAQTSRPGRPPPKLSRNPSGGAPTPLTLKRTPPNRRPHRPTSGVERGGLTGDPDPPRSR